MFIYRLNYVMALAFHLDGGPVGGLYGVLSQLPLGEDDIYEILRSSNDTQSALETGLIRSGKPPPVAARIAEIAEELMNESEAAKHDPKVMELASTRFQQEIVADSRKIPKPFEFGTPKADLPQFHPIASAFPNKGGSHGPYSPGSSSEARRVLDTGEASAGDVYRALEAREFGAAAVTFGDAIKTVRGWGGIVFGSPVRSSTDVPTPIAVAFRPNPSGASNGHLIFFTEHESLETGLVPSEDVRAAYLILFAGAEGLKPAQSGDPIGLVGYIDRVEYFDLDDKGNPINEGIRFRPIIHPALKGLELAHVVARLDGYPDLTDALPRMVERTGGKEAADRVTDWLNEKRDTWKLTDVPSVVTRDHQKISVERDDRDGNWPSSLREQGFLNFISFYEDKPRTEEKFYSLLPDLTLAVADYERLNNFARTFALLQWARDNGAKFIDKTVPEVPTVNTSFSVIISSKGIVEAPAYRRVEAIDEQRIKVEQAIANVLNGAPPEVKQLDAALEQAQSNALAMAVRVQEDAQWATAPPPKPSLLQRLRGLVSRRAATPTPETARAAVEGALPSAKPIVEKMIGIAGDPTNAAYHDAIKAYGPEIALFGAIRYLLPNKWDWYNRWYLLRDEEIRMVVPTSG
jgi:hypothetical protein